MTRRRRGPNFVLALTAVADIGTTLREARMRARIDITEAETRTKIRAKYLRAIENEEWDLLPGPVYVRSFLRTYGDFLGLDSRALVEEYKRRYEGRPSENDTRPATSLRRERERAARGPLIPPWALIGSVLVAVVVALYFLGKSSTSKPTPAVTATRHAAQPPRHRVTHHSAAAPRPRVATLQLTPTGRVYVCLVDGHGKALIPGVIYDQGQTIPTEKSSKLLLTLGNASVQMKVNGKPMPVAASAASIGYVVSPSGAKLLPASHQPRCA
jgi:cytoskeleton protein RodZ